MRHQKRRPAHRTRRRLQLERVMGIEPTLSAWEAEVLPLNYTRTGRQSMPAARVMAIRGGRPAAGSAGKSEGPRSEEHTSELQSLMRNSYAVFCLTKQKHTIHTKQHTHTSHQ